MSVGERILLSLSRPPGSPDYPPSQPEVPVDQALGLLEAMFPNLADLVAGKRVVDFGCGVGQQSIALVKKYGCSVVGVDTNPRSLGAAINNARVHAVAQDALSFVDRLPGSMRGGFDVVISQNSFEHFPQPARVLEEMSSLLNDSGIVLITFGPPWLSPYGSHMYFFCRVPWVNVLFSERTVMNVRARFRNDGAKRYEDVESGLNRMTIAKFEAIVSSCNLRIRSKQYDCVKGVDVLAKLPFIREFFINNVRAVLAKSG